MSGLKTFYNVLKRQYIVNDNESYNYQDSNNVYYYFDEEFAMFSYELGIELFSFYNCNEDSSLMERAQISKEIFNTVKDVDFQEKKMVQNFNNICKFYDDTDKNSTNTPNYETLYADMISTLTSVVEEIDEYKSIDTDNDNSIFIKLTIYKSSLDYINSYKTSMAKFGKVEQETIIDLIELISDKNDLIELEKNGSRAAETKQYISNMLNDENPNSLINKVNTTYINLNR